MLCNSWLAFLAFIKISDEAVILLTFEVVEGAPNVFIQMKLLTSEVVCSSIFHNTNFLSLESNLEVNGLRMKKDKTGNLATTMFMYK